MLALMLMSATTASTMGHAIAGGDTVALTLCPAADAPLAFAAAPTATAAKLELKAKPGQCVAIGGPGCASAGHGCLVEGPCKSAPAWKTAPAPGGVGVQIRSGNICFDFCESTSGSGSCAAHRIQAFDCGGTSANVNQHWLVDTASKTISSAGQGAMAPWKGFSDCMHAVPPAPPPPPPKSALWCPQFHEIQGHYDPSGPILVDGVWHVFPDGSTAPGKGWSHFTSKDLLRWQRQVNSTVAGGDTGSVSLTENDDVVALYPVRLVLLLLLVLAVVVVVVLLLLVLLLLLLTLQREQDNDPKTGGRALFRQTPTADGGAGKLGLNVQWSKPTVGVDKPASLGKGMRDPARALKVQISDLLKDPCCES